MLYVDLNKENVRLMHTKRRKHHQLAIMMGVVTAGILAIGSLHSGSASAQSCKPPPPITHLASTAIAGHVYAGGGPLPRRGSCTRRFDSLIGAKADTAHAGEFVKLATPSGRVIEIYYVHADGLYRFAVRPGLYVVSAYLSAGEEVTPHCQSKTVRVRRHERKIVNLGCNVP